MKKKTYPLSERYDGKRFYNDSPIEERGLSDLFKWWWQGGKKTWPTEVTNEAEPELPSGEVDPTKLYVTYVNHASFLIQMSGLNILTDPIYSERASPISWAGPKRARKPGIEFDKLPRIDYVFISHNHYDHLDLPTIKRLFEKFNPEFIVPLGNVELLRTEGDLKILELDWWQNAPLARGASITLVPSQHWSARGIFDRSHALWGGFIISQNTWKVHFQGDTGHGPFFKKIQKAFPEIDLSILPIGAYEPRWFMKGHHMNPEDAVLAHLDLKSHHSLASHFETFQLTDEAIGDPRLALAESLKQHGIAEDIFQALKTGQTRMYLKN